MKLNGRLVFTLGTILLGHSILAKAESRPNPLLLECKSSGSPNLSVLWAKIPAVGPYDRPSLNFTISEIPAGTKAKQTEDRNPLHSVIYATDRMVANRSTGTWTQEEDGSHLFWPRDHKQNKYKITDQWRTNQTLTVEIRDSKTEASIGYVQFNAKDCVELHPVKAPPQVKVVGEKIGSGFFMQTPDGPRLFTDSHVLRGKHPVEIQVDGVSLKASDFEIALDLPNPKDDLAVLKPRFKNLIRSEWIASPVQADRPIPRFAQIVSNSGVAGPLAFESANKGEKIAITGLALPGASGGPIIGDDGRVLGIYQSYEFGGLRSFGLSVQDILNRMNSPTQKEFSWENGTRVYKNGSLTIRELPSPIKPVNSASRALGDADGGGRGDGDGGGRGDGGNGKATSKPYWEEKIQGIQLSKEGAYGPNRRLVTSLLLPRAEYTTGVEIQNGSQCSKRMELPMSWSLLDFADIVDKIQSHSIPPAEGTELLVDKDAKMTISSVTDGILKYVRDAHYSVQIREGSIEVETQDSVPSLQISTAEKSLNGHLNIQGKDYELKGDIQQGLAGILASADGKAHVAYRFEPADAHTKARISWTVYLQDPSSDEGLRVWLFAN